MTDVNRALIGQNCKLSLGFTSWVRKSALTARARMRGPTLGVHGVFQEALWRGLLITQRTLIKTYFGTTALSHLGITMRGGDG